VASKAIRCDLHQRCCVESRGSRGYLPALAVRRIHSVPPPGIRDAPAGRNAAPRGFFCGAAAMDMFSGLFGMDTVYLVVLGLLMVACAVLEVTKGKKVQGADLRAAFESFKNDVLSRVLRYVMAITLGPPSAPPWPPRGARSPIPARDRANAAPARTQAKPMAPAEAPLGAASLQGPPQFPAS